MLEKEMIRHSDIIVYYFIRYCESFCTQQQSKSKCLQNYVPTDCILFLIVIKNTLLNENLYIGTLNQGMYFLIKIQYIQKIVLHFLWSRGPLVDRFSSNELIKDYLAH